MAERLKWTSCSGVGCMEVAKAKDGTIYLRGSEDRTNVVRMNPGDWKAFLEGAKKGRFDNL